MFNDPFADYPDSQTHTPDVSVQDWQFAPAPGYYDHTPPSDYGFCSWEGCRALAVRKLRVLIRANIEHTDGYIQPQNGKSCAYFQPIYYTGGYNYYRGFERQNSLYDR
jgi:hypothetical protein